MCFVLKIICAEFLHVVMIWMMLNGKLKETIVITSDVDQTFFFNSCAWCHTCGLILLKIEASRERA